MTTPTYQALIVDDESISRKMMAFALTQEGFACDNAEDGDEAALLCRNHSYDLVVTDLIMPNRNGHTLVVDLLAGKARPVVIVHTSVDDSRITKDLLARGVDDVVYKPTNYKTLAARAAVLVGRRRESLEVAAPRPQSRNAAEILAVDIAEMESRMAELPKILPISQAAFDVYNLAGSDDAQVSQIATAISRDPSLSADVLRLANSAFCRNNPSGKKIIDLEEAVLRVGQKRIGELALATSALSGVTPNLLPWINLDLAWRRSVAAGVAVDLLLSRGDYPGVSGGLFLSAIMHLLGRLGLGMLYPQQYQRMIERCLEGNETLDEHEERVFPLNTGQVMSALLKAWNIPEEICEPLNYVSNSFLALAPLDDPLRTQVELLKLAILIGRFAVGKWDCWDKVEFPSTSVLKRLRINSLDKLIKDTQTDTQQIIALQKQPAKADGKSAAAAKKSPPAPQCVKQLAYLNLSLEAFDFLREVVGSMGVTLDERDPQCLDADRNVLINCLWNPPQRLAEAFPPGRPCGNKLIVSDANHLVFYRKRGHAIALPISYGAFQAACLAIAQDVEPADQAEPAAQNA
jgi:HD-like signal output (HDOD) protein/FixJ family two-component response regulator